MSATTLFPSLFEHKAWADDEFLGATAKVDAGRHADDRQAAIRLLNHIHVVDRIFAAHLVGGTHPYTATNTPETPSLQALRDAMRETDRWYVGYVASLPPERLAEPVDFTFTDGQNGRMSREEILGHLLTHGAYHRGGVAKILAPTGVATPRDILTGFLHRTDPGRRVRG